MSFTVDIAKRLDALPFRRFHYLLVGLILSALAFDNSDQITLSFIIPLYRQEWGIDAATASLNPILGIAGTLIGAILGGFLADRIGRRKTFLMSIGIFSATSGLNGFSWSFQQVVASCFVMGVGVGAAIPIAFSLLTEYTPTKIRGRTEVIVGILSISGGYAIASVAALTLAPIFGWRSLFLIGIVPIAIVAGSIPFIPESPRFLAAKGRVMEAFKVLEGLEKRAGKRSDVISSTFPQEVPLIDHQDLKNVAFRELLSRIYRKRTALNWIYGVTWGFFNFGFLIWLPTLLISKGFSSTEASFMATVMNAISIPSAFATAILFERWGRKPTLALFPLIAGVFMILLGWFASGAVNPLMLIGLGGIIFFTGASLAGSFGPYTAEVYPTEIRATGSGWAIGFTRVGGLLGPFVGGALVAITVPIFNQLMVFGIPLIAGSVAMFALGLETRQKLLEEI